MQFRAACLFVFAFAAISASIAAEHPWDSVAENSFVESQDKMKSTEADLLAVTTMKSDGDDGDGDGDHGDDEDDEDSIATVAKKATSSLLGVSRRSILKPFKSKKREAGFKAMASKKLSAPNGHVERYSESDNSKERSKKFLGGNRRRVGAGFGRRRRTPGGSENWYHCHKYKTWAHFHHNKLLAAVMRKPPPLKPCNKKELNKKKEKSNKEKATKRARERENKKREKNRKKWIRFERAKKHGIRLRHAREKKAKKRAERAKKAHARRVREQRAKHVRRVRIERANKARERRIKAHKKRMAIIRERRAKYVAKIKAMRSRERRWKHKAARA